MAVDQFNNSGQELGVRVGNCLADALASRGAKAWAIPEHHVTRYEDKLKLARRVQDRLIAQALAAVQVDQDPKTVYRGQPKPPRVDKVLTTLQQRGHQHIGNQRPTLLSPLW